MPRRRRRSPSPAEQLTLDDDEDSLNNDDLSSNSGRCPPQQRNAANARERARMRVLSKAFCRLKTTLPWVPADTKLSKLDTLRLASGYIAHLRALLADQPSEDMSNGRPLNLTWPFTFQQGSWNTSPGRSVSPQPAQPVQQPNMQSSCNADIFNNNNCYARTSHFANNENYYDQLNRENSYIRQTYSDNVMHSG
ncbi:uncharacterized protein LOC143919045 [Arctopsyche grandis]|uniref:uncharacterized protein LOC143919045 n=1 Tax=Arctopsyche grandis TaxID=121162 RepID=UPI00406D944D